MSAVRKVMIGLAGVGVLLVGGGAMGAGWVTMQSNAVLGTKYDAHVVDFPIPFPLTPAEIEVLRTERAAPIDPAAPVDPAAAPVDPLAGVDLAALALDRAVERGAHLVAARYACGECHGADFAGGTMIDDPMMGQLLGPNLTRGKGSRTLTYTASDWDRMVRHGIRPDGHASPMPSKDFFAMSDRELSDIVAYIQSLPAVDAEVAPVAFGPVGLVLVATGAFEFSATVHPAHDAAHVVEPPPEAPDAVFGRHIALACTGCHRANFAGGPIIGGPPDWPPAANLTPTGLAGWTYEGFVTAMREGKRPDGTPLRTPMAEMGRVASNMTETELRAMWAFIQTLPPTPGGG
jgi:cytochrome c553